MSHSTLSKHIGLCAVFAFLGALAFAQINKQQIQRIEAALPEKARVAPKKPRRLLLWNTPFMDKSPHKGYTIPQAEYAFMAMGKKTGAYETTASDDIALLAPDKIRQFDAILLNNANGPWIRPTEKDLERMKPYGTTVEAVEMVLRKSFLDFVRDGGGLFAYHHALGGNTHWPEFLELIGAKFDGHPWNEEVGIRNEEPDHPLLAAFGGKDFRIADEIFQFAAPYDRAKLRVLLSLDTKTTNMGVPWINRKDGDFAQAWVKLYGKGRVFYCGIGHRTEIWWNPVILRFYLDALQFVLGDLDAPATPR
ncbi:MAG: ThuA domain-containing protein [Candidatus Sumerlaeia bacterium]|nr:ThuA domain-containing protein [Candidatus Sumerlaeia bacterium]